jgi:hypothetical protein
MWEFREAAAGHPVVIASATKRNLASLILFGIAFGYVEAAVVVYLRALSEPIRAQAGLAVESLFPLTTFTHLGPYLRMVKIEVVREAATLIMLAAVAIRAKQRGPAFLAAFALAFGVWDLAFYASLQALIGWPGSLFTWDLLFLLPVPWAAPVLAPVIVSASLVTGGVIALIREPARVGWIAWSMLILGGAIILISLTWDWRNIVDGGLPRPFPWGIFAAGELIGILGFIRGTGSASRIT